MKFICGIVGVILLQSVVLINGQLDPNFCVGKENGAYPHPEPTSCHLFVVCAFSNPILQECPANQIFVPWLGASPPYGECEAGDQETCQLATTTPPTVVTSTNYPETPGEICDGILFRRVPHPDNCYQYVFCIAQKPHLGECESHQIFHPEWNICIRGDRVECRFCLFC